MKSNLFLAVILSLSGLFLLDCMGIAIKYLRDDYPAAQLSVFRNLFGMIPCFIVLYFSKDWHANGKKLVIKRWRFGLARGLIMSFAQLCLYTSYLYLPYALVATHASADGKEGNIEMGLVEVEPDHWVDRCGVNCG